MQAAHYSSAPEVTGSTKVSRVAIGTQVGGVGADAILASVAIAVLVADLDQVDRTGIHIELDVHLRIVLSIGHIDLRLEVAVENHFVRGIGNPAAVGKATGGTTVVGVGPIHAIVVWLVEKLVEPVVGVTLGCGATDLRVHAGQAQVVIHFQVQHICIHAGAIPVDRVVGDVRANLGAVDVRGRQGTVTIDLAVQAAIANTVARQRQEVLVAVGGAQFGGHVVQRCVKLCVRLVLHIQVDTAAFALLLEQGGTQPPGHIRLLTGIGRGVYTVIAQHFGTVTLYGTVLEYHRTQHAEGARLVFPGSHGGAGRIPRFRQFTVLALQTE